MKLPHPAVFTLATLSNYPPTPWTDEPFSKAPLPARPTLALTRKGLAENTNPSSSDLNLIQKEIEKRHDESVQRLQHWIRQPSLAAEKRGVNEGCDLTMSMLGDAGFSAVTKIPTDGQPGIFATLDAGAPRTIGLYFMYDVKQADPAEWSSPPFDAALVDKPGPGKVVMGRGCGKSEKSGMKNVWLPKNRFTYQG